MMLNPIEAEQSTRERIREAHAFVENERLAQELVAGRKSHRAGWKRRIGRWLIRLGERWAPGDPTPEGSSHSSMAGRSRSASC